MTLIQELKQNGLEEQEIYGSIINAGINGDITQKNAKVDLMSILITTSNNINEQDAECVKEELEEMGISRELAEKKMGSNIYLAKRIVECYDFGRELTIDEKKSLIRAVLDTTQLNKNSYKLSTLLQRFEQIGLNEQEIFGTIINLGVNGVILDEVGGCGYRELLANRRGAFELIEKNKNNIQKSVTPMTILSAQSANMTEQEELALREELLNLGINKELLEITYASNLYIAKRIVEEYNFGKELSQEKKRALMQAIVRNSILSKRKRSLSTLMQRFEQMGLDEQGIYGTIINLGVNGVIVDEPGCGYSELLMNSGNACQKVAHRVGEIQTVVTQHTIEKALNKSEKIMKKSVKCQKDKGTIANQSVTRNKLVGLVKAEIQQLKEEKIEK